MTQLEEELVQLARRWTEDAENILRAVGGPSDDYYTGYASGIAQAAKELRKFMWGWFCRGGDAAAMAGMMYRNGGQ